MDWRSFGPVAKGVKLHLKYDPNSDEDSGSEPCPIPKIIGIRPRNLKLIINKPELQRISDQVQCALSTALALLPKNKMIRLIFNVGQH